MNEAFRNNERILAFAWKSDHHDVVDRIDIGTIRLEDASPFFLTRPNGLLMSRWRGL